MDDNEKEFNFKQFWGSSLIAPHVVFRRNSQMYCVYCGSFADTREHCPSKTFLNKPFPTDLSTVPACKKCNNGFSSDERYTSNVISCLSQYYKNADMKIFEITEADKFKEMREAKQSAKRFISEPFFDDRMANIFRKLAIGHAAFEISEGYYNDSWNGIPERISYTIKPFLEGEQWKDLEYAEVINDQPVPEIGSRAFRNIYVVEALMNSSEGDEINTKPLLMVDWVDIQDGYYKYQVYFKNDKIWVKMIFQDFLYCEVIFSRSN